ncbi:hypothetical protein BGZ58_002959 [Dissophora ornata]|nr:hypothetical protein BGZ58_002959 [Dissophora ornata]
MYPRRALDKENDIVADPTLVKQASLTRTPSALQLQQGLKANLTRTPTQPGKTFSSALFSPSVQSVLRAKTNFQQLPTTATDTINKNNNNNDGTPLKRKDTLTRTFSASLDNTSINNEKTSGLSSTPLQSENRRRSLTKRGSAKARLLVHKDDDEEVPQEELDISLEMNNNVDIKDNNNNNSSSSSNSSTAILVKSAPVETATTLLSIERGSKSQDKVVVGSAETDTKRRALTNHEDRWDIEYAPPREQEQPYDPGFELDAFALSTVPPALSYHVHSIDDFDIGLPEIMPAKIVRSGDPTQPEEKKEKEEKQTVLEKMTSQEKQKKPVNDDDVANEEEEEEDATAAMPKSTISADGHINVVWSDDEGGDELHPKGGYCFGIKDLLDETKTRPPFDGFVFELDASDDSLSEDDDDIFSEDASWRRRGVDVKQPFV